MLHRPSLRQMCVSILALTLFTIFFLSPSKLTWATEAATKSTNDMEIPSALLEDDSFEDLPFEQLRQALREEVERDPEKRVVTHSFKRNNFLIR